GSYSYPRTTSSRGTSRPLFLLKRLKPTGEKSFRSSSEKSRSCVWTAGWRLTGISTSPKLMLPFQNARAMRSQLLFEVVSITPRLGNILQGDFSFLHVPGVLAGAGDAGKEASRT